MISRRAAARSVIVGWFAMLAAAPHVARAQDALEAKAGEALAAKLCSPCHIVTAPIGPSFAEIAKNSYATPDALGNFLRSTHSDAAHPGGMPTQSLTDEQVAQIAAYLATLRGSK